MNSVTISGVKLYYKGNIGLLDDLKKNVAVIGVLNPATEICTRESKFVKQLVENGCKIVSGLAKGCDTIAHKICIANGGKTIAILPTTLENIFPKENVKLAEQIVESGGLLVTEYETESKNRYESIRRFIERDRLQALFSNTVILTASYRKGEGDAGSRHAMDYAKKIGRTRYVMFNKGMDSNDPQFGLNADYLRNEKDVKILSHETIKGIFT